MNLECCQFITCAELEQQFSKCFSHWSNTSRLSVRAVAGGFSSSFLFLAVNPNRIADLELQDIFCVFPTKYVRVSFLAKLARGSWYLSTRRI
jgi:hypothetical protein